MSLKLFCLFCYPVRTSSSSFKFDKYFKILQYFDVKRFCFTKFCLTEKQVGSETILKKKG